MNEIYGRAFSSAPPASSTVEVDRLPKDARIEIDLIALGVGAKVREESRENSPGGALVGRDETVRRKKYEAPTVIRGTLESLSPKVCGEVAHIISGTVAGIHALVKSNGDCRIVLDLEGRFKQVSEEFLGLIGRAEDELLGTRIDGVTVSRTVNIPQHLGAVLHFGHFHCLWMFVHRWGQAIATGSCLPTCPSRSLASPFLPVSNTRNGPSSLAKCKINAI